MKKFWSSADSPDYTEVPTCGASSMVSSCCPSLFTLFTNTLSHCVSEYQTNPVDYSNILIIA